jgi:hypothetical protein
MNAKEKALALSYVLTQLLKDNLDVAVLEMRESRDADANRLDDKLAKLRGASNNAFRILERNVGDDLDNLKEDVEKVLEQLWG